MHSSGPPPSARGAAAADAAKGQAKSQSPLGVEFVPLTTLLQPRGQPPAAAASLARPPPPPRTVWGGVLDDSVLTVAPPSKQDSESALKARTYYRRKEEKAELEREVAGLETQLQHLAKRDRLKRQREEVATREANNNALRYAIRSQRIAFANTTSFMNEFLRAHDHSLYEPTICLGTDPEARREVLLSMKSQRLEEALGFLTERQRFMNRTAAFTDQQQFVASNGDYCSVRFDILPIHGARSVKQVFDAVLKFTYNLEISISATLGDITLRENDDVKWNSTVAQHRLVTSIGDVIEVDTNNVTFAEYQPDSGTAANSGSSGWGWDGVFDGKELGVAACNYVAEDRLYPYNPSRVRQDITYFVLVTSYPRSAMRGHRPFAPPDAEDDQVVVVSRWTCLRVRQPGFYVPEDVMERIRDALEQVGSAMVSEVRAACCAGSSK